MTSHSPGSVAVDAQSSSSTSGSHKTRRQQRKQGAKVKEWSVSRQVPRGIRPRCAGCKEIIEDQALRAKPATQKVGTGACWYHLDCLPVPGPVLCSDGLTDKEFTDVKGRFAGVPISDPALSDCNATATTASHETLSEVDGHSEVTAATVPVDMELESSPHDTGMTLMNDGELTEAGKRRDAYEAARLPTVPPPPTVMHSAVPTDLVTSIPNLEWWDTQPWINPDLPPDATAVQVPNGFKSEYIQAKMSLLKTWTWLQMPKRRAGSGSACSTSMRS